MAESVVSSAAHHIVSMINEEASAISEMKPELDALHAELMMVQEYLVEAEQKKELVDNEQVRSWLAELGRIAYEAEDIVDTFVLDAEHLFKFLRARKTVKQLRGLRLRMQEIKSKLDNYGEGSTDSKKERRSWVRGSQASKSHLHADDDYVVGIDGDVSRLVKQLVGKSNDDQPRLDVLAIVGMGGSGKTTLARKIYNNQVVKRHFKCRAWVPLSRGWNASAVMFDILRQTASSNKNKKGSTHYTDEGLEVLGSWLQDSLRWKMCLVVLDDVWESELKSLHAILPLLIPQDKVSTGVIKIVITSRNRVLSPDNRLHWSFHDTQCLGKEDSWKLFSKVASKTGKELDKDYQALSMEMLRKCEGLPLAIVALGKLLKSKDTIQEWERVFSQIESAEGTHLYRPVNDILALSYDELPYYLKPCFLYLGLFPEGSSISAGTLARMWIAEGFVRQRQGEDTLEDAARRRLQELIDHTMVQVVRRNYAGKVITLRVHDIMRDLCLMKARDLDFLTVFSLDSEANTMPSRRAAVNLSMCRTLPIHNSHLRSLLLFGQSSTGLGVDAYAGKGNKATLNLVPLCEYFKLLRVLDLSGIKSSDGTLPKQMGSLIHLRYLRIRSTNIRALPKSIGNLRNLLTLEYWDVAVGNEIKLPNVLWKLRRLRHLYLPNEVSSSSEDLKLHTMKDLQTLWGIGGGYWMLRGMKHLSSSLKKLCIQGISSRDHLEALFNSPIIKTHNRLYALALDWYGFDLESVDALHSVQSLQKLRLMGTTHTPDKSKPLKFPSNLQKIELYYTQLDSLETMVALGELRSLKFLRLSKDSFAGSEWTCSKDSFLKLEELKLCNLPNLAEWKMELGAMPCLKKLSIVSCIKLGRIPEGVKFISTLQKLEIERMPQSFCSRLQHTKEQKATRIGEDFHIVQHIPYIGIRDPYSSML